MNVELELLVARLRWPVGCARWWAMQELALLLVSPEHQSQVSDRLIGELTACKLEAEAVELMSIFWIAQKQGWVARPDLGAAVSRPSMLTDRLLADMGLEATSNIVPPLATLPRDYEIPEEFERRQGRDVPRIHHTLASDLEERTGMPFLHQMAYEWEQSKAAYPDAPLQGDLSYFVRPAGDHGAGSFADRTSLRMLTAFIRTMEVARTLWRAPDRFAFNLARRAIPLEPTFAFLRPSRPVWLPTLCRDSGFDAASVARFVVEAIAGLKALDGAGALLALSTPMHVSGSELIELTVVRWRRWGAKAIDPAELWSRYEARQHMAFGTFDSAEWGLKSQISSLPLREVLDRETGAAPMAALFGIGRIGYLQRDLFPSRLYLPVVSGLKDELLAEPADGAVVISAPGGLVASLGYWGAGWSACYPAGNSGLVGTALVGRLNAPLGEGEEPPDGHFYLWRLSKLKRENGYGRYEQGASIVGIVEG
ncbi:hypothetical protein J2X16_004891 [Pelomonas aquatica]|uniref:Uncharacterized protein n=1 Tax=Pelomonas aquatica TaxID=431058 RepID=A0ABU1ZHI3_9BURK|nr:hypothetical protein [Pelomonas aquatica]MDR7299521.1 hypothetical protein [Pelomonas aquatica]